MPEVLTRVIDACVHVSWPSDQDIWAYLPADWQEYVGRPNTLPGGHGARNIHIPSPFRAPGMPRQIDPSEPAPPAHDGLEHAVLVQEPGVFLSTEPNPHLAREIASAANRWLTERWLEDGDGRRLGVLVAANQNPEEAAAEVRRAGAHPRMVGVLLGASGLDKGFGHPVYDPLHRAAAELGLPLLVHSDGNQSLDSPFQVSAAGQPATYSEARLLSAQALMTHVVSFVAHGVFERYPTLRVLAIGGAMSWLPGFLWRFDADYKGMHRETPWVKRMPHEYVREHVRVTTYPLDTAAHPDGLRQALGTFDGMEDVLVFASGAPRSDATDPGAVARVLPEAWHSKAFAGNAAALFGL
jgi:hypothetical protein